ncbi:ribose-5-phosphate isomerase RpiA [Nguyenibacter vanlangensis]|uniref:Ribose-5-phosphate isomerase A n=1 Tax=Nguyenibacter vanlangensis TaxID=1216886 RepID=A0A7Y7IW74_9PROT|nr:ribose-5-phosphate isomerase RpiA [Nguyenibacter vanlangensis]NVN11495.1 ribose-5-phosphate isomerase RpiA [Nguyenibacter vanlangensis]
MVQSTDPQTADPTADPMIEFKRQVAEEAAAMVRNGMAVGLGTGSTSAMMIDALGRRWAQGLRFVAIPTSERSAAQARGHGITLVSFATHPQLDLAIDGADEVERGSLNLVKGLGGALLREKIVAAAARRFIVMVDEGKLVDHLGSHAPIPVEVTPFGWESTARQLGELGARVSPRMDRDGNLFVTDGGNMILDCAFGPIADPPGLAADIRRIVGVIETGLFIGRTSEVLVAGRHGLTRLVAA